MKRVFRHLLWIGPLVFLIAVVSMAGYAATARSSDQRYHSKVQNSIQITSNDFQSGQEIPVEFSCKGAGRSPHIRWDHAPAGTRSYALIMMDWDAPFPSLPLFAVAHWVLYNIPEGVRQISQGSTNEDMTSQRIDAGLNMGGQPGYTAPCPPFGTHRYEFRVYALAVDRIQPASKSKAEIMKAMDGHILAYGELVGWRRP